MDNSPNPPPRGTRLFQINEGDLAELERSVPELCRLATEIEGYNEAHWIKAMIRRVQKIVVDVRWDYGPPSEVHSIPDDHASKGD